MDGELELEGDGPEGKEHEENRWLVGKRLGPSASTPRTALLKSAPLWGHEDVDVVPPPTVPWIGFPSNFPWKST